MSWRPRQRSRRARFAPRARSLHLRLWAASLLILLGLLANRTESAPDDPTSVHVVRVDGAITGVTTSFLDDALSRCAADRCQALVVELDTPGGLLDATKDIVGSFLNAPVPVVVYVSPRGAWAASAGTFITMAGHVAAMAPGATIGAAHPVMSDGADPGGPTPLPPAPSPDEKEGRKPGPAGRSNFIGQKLENMTVAFAESIARERNRNLQFAARAVRESIAIGSYDAVDQKVVDLVADDLDDLLVKIDGKQVRVGNGVVALKTKGARVVRNEMTWQQRVLEFLGSPQIAGLLLMAGLFGLYTEFNNPGGIFPGVAGVLCLVLAGLGLQVIPFSSVGLLLILLGVGMMTLEVFVPAFGFLFGAGVVSLAVGGYLLFDVPEIGDLAPPFWTVIFPPIAVLAVLGGFMVFAVSRTMLRPAFAGSGAEGLVGQIAIADSAIAPRGRVRLQGELWNAESAQPIEPGESVRIESVEDLVVRVTRAAGRGED